MASGDAISGRMRAMGVGLIDSWQGISALHAALQPRQPASTAFWLVGWDVMLKAGKSAPALLSSLVSRVDVAAATR